MKQRLLMSEMQSGEVLFMTSREFCFSDSAEDQLNKQKNDSMHLKNHSLWTFLIPLLQFLSSNDGRMTTIIAAKPLKETTESSRHHLKSSVEVESN
jgi:hypothetical protein